MVGAQAANELLNIVGVKASFVLTEYEGKVYISARAIDEVNVQIIMERLGGGGPYEYCRCTAEGYRSGGRKGEAERSTDTDDERRSDLIMKVILLQDVKALEKRAKL